MIISKDMEVLTNSFSNQKTVSKDNSKDFLKILENQKISQDRPKVVNVDKEKPNGEVKVQEKKADYKPVEEDPTEEDNKIEEEIYDELITLFQTFHNLILKLEDEPLGLEKFNLGTLKLEVKELFSTLGQAVEHNIPSFTHENMIEMCETIEDLISSLENELDKVTNDLKERPIDLQLEEILIELSTIKGKVEQIKGYIQLTGETNINFENEENVVDINNLSNQEMEFDEILSTESTEKEVSRTNEPMGESLVEEGEDFKTQNVDSNDLLFEVMDRKTIKENPEIIDKILSKLDEKQIIEQIVSKAKLTVDDNRQELRIKLKPEILGELMLKMEVVKGDILAKIMVDNHRTKELIEANLFQFKEDMKENGLEIKTFEVFVGTNEDFERENTEQFNFKKRPNRIKVKDEELKEIKIYDENTLVNIEGLYEEGRLNLFA